jgi:5-dehydro-2-deoxygluconokinase
MDSSARDRTQAAFQRLRLNRFLVLGRVGMDLYADPPGTRIETATRFTTALGGSAGNIAVALARQGARVALVSCVSDDAVGRFCLAELHRYAVDTTHVRAVKGEARNSLAIVETRPADAQTVLYRNNAADFAMTTADVTGVAYDGIAALVVTGTALAREPSREATFTAMRLARDHGTPVILDLDYRSYSWSTRRDAARICLEAARASDAVVGNDDEFGLLAGSHDRGPDLAADLARSALFTVYKRGPEGSTTFAAGHSFDTPIFPVEALKPMGAGDGFLGGLLAGLAQGLSLEAAVQRGAATAALIVAGIGCAPASPDTVTLDAFLNR